MTPLELGEVVERLFKTFAVPLVVGGAMAPGRPIGGKTALLIDDGRTPSDTETFSHVHLARIRRARELAPIDRFEAFSRAEWVLLAALHDLAQATHPDLTGLFRSKTPGRLIQMVSLTLDRVPTPATAKEALSRHSIFARMFDIRRVTTEVKWWTGSAKFVGTKPPSRLTAWPEFRRVNIHEIPEPFTALPVGKAQAEFLQTIAKFLTRSPLTDYATCDRPEPAFTFGPENVALISTSAGRTLVLRALAHLEPLAADAALGKAVRVLIAARAFRPLFSVLTLLSERALGRAQEELSKSPEAKPLPLGEENDANFARAIGALSARRYIAEHGECFREHERKSILALLELRATSPSAREFEALLG